MTRPRRRLALVAVCLVALGSRALVVDRQGLWADEVFSLAIATGHSLEHPAREARPELGDFVEGQGPAPARAWGRYTEHEGLGSAEVWRAVRLSDTNPPLYYQLLYLWTRVLGTSDRALRGFSILASLAAYPFIARLARRIGGRAALWPACVIYALAPLSVYYSTEGRMYSLLWLASAAVADASLALRAERARAPALARWVLWSLVGLWTHYFFVFVWCALCTWLLLWPGRASRRRIAAGAAIALALSAPWYAGLARDLAAWRVTEGWLEVRPPGWSFASSAWDAFFGHLSGRGVWGGGTRAHAVALALFCACAATFAWRAIRGRRSPVQVLPWLWLVAPVVGLIALDRWRGTYSLSQQRYALAGLPAAVVIAASAFAAWPQNVRHVALAGLLLTWLPALRQVATNAARCDTPFRQVAEDLSRRNLTGDLVIVHSIPSGVIGLARYLDEDVEVAAWVEQLGDRRLPEDAERLLAGRQRVRLVRVHEAYAEAPIEDELRRRWRAVRSESREIIRVLELEDPGVAQSEGERP